MMRLDILPEIIDFDYRNEKYIILSTRMRAHKNCLILVKSLKRLKEIYKFHIKLVVTHLSPEVQNFIEKNCLKKYIIPMISVLDDIHYVLFQNAHMAVHTSPFEATLASAFVQAVPLGVPALIPNVETNTNIIPYLANQEFYFDPYNLEDLCQKIIYISENRKRVALKQKKILENHELLAKRAWSKVAREFYELMGFY